MSNNNGNGLSPKVKITNGNGFERHESEHAELKSISLKDGVSIIASGGDGAPKEVRLFVKVPGVDLAPCVTFRRHEMLTDIIEQLIAYRRYVFPDAPELDTTKTVGKTREVVIGEE